VEKERVEKEDKVESGEGRVERWRGCKEQGGEGGEGREGGEGG
jgi:hypothetical protein